MLPLGFRAGIDRNDIQVTCEDDRVQVRLAATPVKQETGRAQVDALQGAVHTWKTFLQFQLELQEGVGVYFIMVVIRDCFAADGF